MALTFPRNMTGGRPWQRAALTPQLRQELSRTAGGDVLVADLGPVLWRASFATYPLRQAAAEAILADFETLDGGARTFLLHPAKRPFPLAIGSPAAYALAGAAINAIRADRSAFRIDGLPPNFPLTAGDLVSIVTATGGRELLRLATGGATSSTGLSPWLELTPPLRPSVATGDAAQLAPPLIEMRLAPDSLTVERVGRSRQVIGFEAWQVVR